MRFVSNFHKRKLETNSFDAFTACDECFGVFRGIILFSSNLYSILYHAFDCFYSDSLLPGHIGAKFLVCGVFIGIFIMPLNALVIRVPFLIFFVLFMCLLSL